MSEPTIEIFDSNNIVEVETLISEVINNLEIDVSTERTIELATDYAGVVVYASDIVGLDTYLSNFIDSYEIDCGTP
jgi:hypothetical protein